MADANNASDHSLLWGYAVELWDRIGIWALVIGAVLGVVALLLTAASAYILYRVADNAQTALSVESRSSAERIARSDERIAALNNETARLQADNLALQRVMMPRHVGLIGLDQEPPAKKWFVGFERRAGTKILIQVTPSGPEAQNLANGIAIVLSKFGWRPEMIDEKRSGISLNLHEGLHVSSPGSYKAWDPTDRSQQVFATLGAAARSLATALTSAGLGVGAYPVSGVNGSIIVVDG
jgi:hypothetical protein